MADQLLQKAITDFYKENAKLVLVSLCTPDGFPIYQASDSFDEMPDKVAAMTSTLSSVSNAISQEILGSDLTLSVIESFAGKCICIYTKYENKEAVLIIAAEGEATLGVLRVRAKRLAEKIMTL